MKRGQLNTLSEMAKKTYEQQQLLLGVEGDAEEDISEAEQAFPYDPDEIRVDRKNFPVFHVNVMIERGQLELKPEFQRNTVWDVTRKSRLIESLMLRIPIPAFYFDEDNEGKKTVIDGLQRLSAIHDFISGKYALRGLQYLQAECGEKYFDQLDSKYRTRIEDAQLTVNILDPQSPMNVKFDIFRRVNTGGIPLNSQEIRNVLASESTRHFLLKMVHSEEFQAATRGHVNDIRMDAQELCLRFITFYLRYDPASHEMTQLKSMGNMMDQCIEDLNSMPQEKLERIYSAFLSSMKKCRALFGDKAFSKPDNEHIINKVLFTSWAVVLCGYSLSEDALAAMQEHAVHLLYHKMDSDARYFTAISSSTGSKTSIKKQFETAYLLMEELVHDTSDQR